MRQSRSACGREDQADRRQSISVDFGVTHLYSTSRSQSTARQTRLLNSCPKRARIDARCSRLELVLEPVSVRLVVEPRKLPIAFLMVECVSFLQRLVVQSRTVIRPLSRAASSSFRSIRRAIPKPRADCAVQNPLDLAGGLVDTSVRRIRPDLYGSAPRRKKSGSGLRPRSGAGRPLPGSKPASKRVANSGNIL
jgi:hypothetical protein